MGITMNLINDAHILRALGKYVKTKHRLDDEFYGIYFTAGTVV